MSSRITRLFKHALWRRTPAIQPMSKADERDLRLLQERRQRDALARARHHHKHQEASS